MKSNQKSQGQYKQQYDKKATTSKFHVGDWVLVYFPQDETGKHWKLSQSWHGPYRTVSRDDPNVTVIKMYFPEDLQIQVHQSRVQMCPDSFPTGLYWYGKAIADNPVSQVLAGPLFPKVKTNTKSK